MKRAVLYLYKLTYLYEKEEKAHVKDTDPFLHARMFAMGTRLCIVSLRKIAVLRLKRWLEFHTLSEIRPVTPLFGSGQDPSVHQTVALLDRPAKLSIADLRIIPEAIKVFWTCSTEESQEMKMILLQHVLGNLDALNGMQSFNAVLHTGIGFAKDWLEFQTQNQ